MAEERQPDEVLRKAQEFGPEWVKRHPEQPKSWLSGSWSDEAMAEFAAAFAQSIQADDRQHCAHCFCECPECKKVASQDKRECSLCGTVRVPLNSEGTKRGACTFTGCKDPLYDYNREKALEPK